MAFVVAFKRLDPNPGAQVHPMVALHLGSDRTNHAAERANERCGAALRNRHGEA